MPSALQSIEVIAIPRLARWQWPSTKPGSSERPRSPTTRAPGPAPTLECYIRYSRELRVGDLMHVDSAVIAVEPDGLRLGHKLVESTDGALCTTVEHRLAVTLTSAQRRAADARRATWDGPP